MKRPMKTSRFALSSFIACLALLPLVSVHAQVTEQNLNLVAGWNAVWFEVQPLDNDGQPLAPVQVFSSPSITQVATPRGQAGLAEFFSDAPTNSTFRTMNRIGWDQWHRNPPVDVANTMPSIQGNQPYLIQCSAAVTLRLEGKVEFFQPDWNPDRYNLVGFGLDPFAPPTFQAFFGPSGDRHPVDEAGREIYAMQANGQWMSVQPGDAMRSGEAYWVYCRGNSDYMGPVSVAFDAKVLGLFNFGGPGNAVSVQGSLLDLQELRFTNLDAVDRTPALVRASNLDNTSLFDDDLEVFVVEPVPTNLSYRVGATVDSVPGDNVASALGETLTARSTTVLTLGAQRNWSAGSVARINVYRLKTGSGSEFWLPVKALHNDLQLSGVLPPAGPAGGADPQMAGLWAGQVVVDQTSSITEDGAPTRAPAGTLSFRILLHAEAGGAVRLLSQVTLMETRNEDPEIEASPVLVLDPTRIPFFEGIQERQGKRVGVRLDAVTYDMPRKLDPADQAELVSAVPGLADDEAVLNYLNSRTIRHPALQERYHLTWPMQGLIGPGQTVNTFAGQPLNLDPFHRSNPFRHAFHQRHPRGPNINRDIALNFEADATVNGQLTGQYTETLRGLIKADLISSGRFTLRRISDVTTLDGVE